MIFTSIIGVLLGLFWAIFVEFIPHVSALPGDVSTSIATLLSSLSSVSALVPITDLLIVLSLVITFELSMLALKIVVFIWNRVH